MKWLGGLLAFSVCVAVFAGVVLPEFRPWRTAAIDDLVGMYYLSPSGAKDPGAPLTYLSIRANGTFEYSPNPSVQLTGKVSISAQHLQVDIPGVYLGDVEWDQAHHVLKFEYPAGKRQVFFRASR